VALGYADMPERTAGAFLADPFAAAPDARMYRTGDRARFLACGDIEFLGRRDSQIKIRGYRVELQEIESALRSHEAVRDAAVVARRERDGRVRRLEAYCIPVDEGPAPSEDDLRAHLEARLPAFMTPAALHAVERFPLNASGKVDRARLLTGAAEAAAPPTRPRTPIETLLHDIWLSVLERSEVGIDEDFLAIGGDSLLIMRLALRLEEETGLAPGLPFFFEQRTIRAQALHVADMLLAEDAGEPIGAVRA
jgi:hypothetical protein